MTPILLRTSEQDKWRKSNFFLIFFLRPNINSQLNQYRNHNHDQLNDNINININVNVDHDHDHDYNYTNVNAMLSNGGNNLNDGNLCH